MINLIENEFLKLHAKKGLYILLGVLALLEGLGAFVTLKWGDPKANVGSALDYVYGDLPLITLFATVFGITIAARTITEEFQHGTVKQLLIRPRKRMTVLFSKYITVLLTVVLIVVIGTIFSMVAGVIIMDGGKTELTLGILLQEMLYQLVAPFFFVTIAFFLANIFRKSVLPLVITLFIFFLHGTISMFLSVFAEKYAKFFVFSHLDFSVYSSNPLLNGGLKPPFPQFDFTTSLLFVLAHFAVLLIASGLLFQKRDVL
ncbi:ABC transporter permease [Bacillus manliponensis]|uniref:ABC transporter permease n=1 Tax=Bacillus manliponensis TaxID=574376 RepID=UPI0035179FA3